MAEDKEKRYLDSMDIRTHLLDLTGVLLMSLSLKNSWIRQARKFQLRCRSSRFAGQPSMFAGGNCVFLIYIPILIVFWWQQLHIGCIGRKGIAMRSENTQEIEVFLVVVNHEEQYSVWPKHKTIPNGWRAVGPAGDKASCLEWIRTHWIDMRPLSVRGTLPR